MEAFKDSTGTRPIPDGTLPDGDTPLSHYAIAAARIHIRLMISAACKMAELACDEHASEMLYKTSIGVCASAIIARVMPRFLDGLSGQDSIIEFRDMVLIESTKDLKRLNTYLSNKSFNPEQVNRVMARLTEVTQEYTNEIIEAISNQVNGSPADQKESKETSSGQTELQLPN